MAKVPSIIIAIGLLLLAQVVSESAQHNRQINKDTRVSYQGIGRVRAGMSLRNAERAVRDKLVSIQDENGGCTFFKPEHGPDGISFMVIHGRIARVDVNNTFTATNVGARVGDSEAKIKRLYRGAVRVSPHAYVEGHYLMVTSRDRRHGIVFETDGYKVTQYRAGRLEAVRHVEGCS